MLKKMEQNCIAYPTYSWQSINQIPLKKKVQAVDVPLETRWCLNLRNVWEMKFAENTVLTFVYMYVLNLIFCVCVWQ